MVITRMHTLETVGLTIFLLIVAPFIENFVPIGSFIITCQTIIILYFTFKWIREIFTKDYSTHESLDLSIFLKIFVIIWTIASVANLAIEIQSVSYFKNSYDTKVEEIKTNDRYDNDEWGEHFRNEALMDARKSYEELVNPHIKWLLLSIIMLLPVVQGIIYVIFYKKYEKDKMNLAVQNNQ